MTTLSVIKSTLHLQIITGGLPCWQITADITVHVCCFTATFLTIIGEKLDLEYCGCISYNNWCVWSLPFRPWRNDIPWGALKSICHLF